MQGMKLLGFRMSGTPKNGDGNPTGNPGIVRLSDSLKLGFSDRKDILSSKLENWNKGYYQAK